MKEQDEKDLMILKETATAMLDAAKKVFDKHGISDDADFFANLSTAAIMLMRKAAETAAETTGKNKDEFLKFIVINMLMINDD